MKRILAVILTLSLLLGAVSALSDVDYASDYETALTLATNDLTNVKGLETAVDILQRLGGYQMARSYSQYFQALMDIMFTEGDLGIARKRIDTCARNAVFVKNLAERGLPSCEEIGTYIDTRETEAAVEYGNA
ncbi:MAG: hypothetical protein IKS31_08810 [Clostridia bacterium]|nr:hypothetical protein [Clostridia bacterium]